MKKCLFCQLYSSTKQNSEIFFKNSHFFCLLDVFPINPGHYLVIPTRHIENFSDLNQEEWIDLHNTIVTSQNELTKINLQARYKSILQKKISDLSIQYCTDVLNSIDRQGFAPTAYNIGVNDGIDAGRTIHHLHIHLIPRFKNDTDNPRGGIRGLITNKQYYS